MQIADVYQSDKEAVIMKKITRRDFLKVAGTAVVGAAAYNLQGLHQVLADDPVLGSQKVAADRVSSYSSARVYFTRHIDSEHLLKLYNLINENIYGKVAIKIHTGEQHGPNILPREMVRDLQRQIPDSVLVETNTLYHGDRYTTADHIETLRVNGWTFCPVDIMDAEGTVLLPVRGGRHFKEVSMGKNIVNYDSMLVLTHFKGHAMGGFGGSMKNLAIGCADGRIGKEQVHGVSDPGMSWEKWPDKEQLMENMAESAKATIDHFGKHIVYINVMRRMSVDCDCAGVGAAEPTIPDIGIVASTDLLAVDQASIDLVYARPQTENHDLVERIESRHGLRQLSYMRELQMGNVKYELITID